MNRSGGASRPHKERKKIMKKYRVTVETPDPRAFKVLEFEDYNNACKIAMKYRRIAEQNGKHWTISFYTGDNLDARMTT